MSVIERIKRNKGKKVGVSLRISSLLKEEAENFCKENGVSMTAFINELINQAMEEVRKEIEKDKE